MSANETVEQRITRQSTSHMRENLKPGADLCFIFRGFTASGGKKVSFVYAVNGVIHQATHAVAALTGRTVVTRDNVDYIFLDIGTWPQDLVEQTAEALFGSTSLLTGRTLG